MTVTVSSNSRSNNGKEVFYKALCDVFGVVEREYKFHPVRKWRNDYFLKDYNIAVEIEGGVFIGGRHTSGMGFSKDIEKYNAALTLGIVVYRIDNQDLKSPDKIVMHLRSLREIAQCFKPTKVLWLGKTGMEVFADISDAAQGKFPPAINVIQ